MARPLQRKAHYLPIGLWHSYRLPVGLEPKPDVFPVPVSASLGRFLDFRNDLGIQTELVTGSARR